MPEKGEAQIMADQLVTAVKGKTLTSMKINEKSKYFTKKLANFDSIKFPLKCLDVVSKGKKIIFFFNFDVYFVFSLGMSGRFIFKEDPYSGLLLDFDSVKVYFSDIRHFGTLEIFLSSETYEKRIKLLGPDILNDDIDKNTWLSIFQNKKLKKKQLCQCLMDQSIVSGIGNYLKSEICYRSAILPNRLMESLSESDLETLRVQSLKTVKEAYESNGLTIQSYLAPDGTLGTYKNLIYKRDVDPNGLKVLKEQFKDRRMSYYVPEVQK